VASGLNKHRGRKWQVGHGLAKECSDVLFTWAGPVSLFLYFEYFCKRIQTTKLSKYKI
jgi:hypothetical protein